MLLTPKILLSNVARERCVACLKELPSFTLSQSQIKPTINAAVLVPLCVVDGEVCLLYTLRSTNLKNHSGQVSFPGGKNDEKEDAFETALRETEEEIGIKREDIDIWGKMPQFRGRDQQMLITPVVGMIRDFDMSKLKCNPSEVEEVFTVPMSSFCDKITHAYFEVQKLYLPVFLYGKFKIWGITGIITHSFLQCFLPSDVYDVDFTRKKFELEDLVSKL